MIKDKPKTRTSVTLPTDLLRDLNILAAKTGRSANSIMLDAITEAVRPTPNVKQKAAQIAARRQAATKSAPKPAPAIDEELAALGISPDGVLPNPFAA